MENLTDSLGSNAFSRSESVLNPINKSCFLCLKELSSNQNDQIAEFDFDLLSLRNLCEYLDLTGLDVNETFASVCSSCYPVVDNLTALIRKLEVTNMLINYQLEKFHEILQSASQKNVEDFTNDVDTNVKIKTESDLESCMNLRARISEKCTEKVDRILDTVPRVVLNRVTIGNFDHLNNTEPFSPAARSDDENLSQDDEYFPNSENYDEDSTCDNDTSLDKESNYKLTKETSDSTERNGDKIELKSWADFSRNSIIYYKHLGKGNKLECKLCNLVRGRPSQNNHLVSVHPDTVFEWYKPKYMDKFKFACLCRHILDRELPVPKTLRKLQCSHCQNAFNSREKLRIHMAAKHYSIVRDNLIKLLKSGNHQEIDKAISSTLNNKMIWSVCRSGNPTPDLISQACHNFYKKPPQDGKQECPICSVKFVIKWDKVHLVTVHPEVVLADLKLNHVSKEQFKLCLVELMKDEARNAEKTKLWGRLAYKCKYCPEVLSRTYNFDYHLVKDHVEVIKEKLAELQSESGLQKSERKATEILKRRKKIRERLGKEQPCPRSQVIQNICTQNYVRIANCKSKYLKCRICKITVRSEGDINRMHMVSAHTDIFFKDMHLENVSIENFKICCKLLLESEDMLFGNKKNAKFQKCKYCGEQMGNLVSLRNHLILKHFEVMEENLVRLQTEEAWLAQEKKACGRKIIRGRKRRIGMSNNDVDFKRSKPSYKKLYARKRANVKARRSPSSVICGSEDLMEIASADSTSESVNIKQEIEVNQDNREVCDDQELENEVVKPPNTVKVKCEPTIS